LELNQVEEELKAKKRFSQGCAASTDSKQKTRKTFRRVEAKKQQKRSKIICSSSTECYSVL
jgi:hypothetical protein